MGFEEIIEEVFPSTQAPKERVHAHLSQLYAAIVTVGYQHPHGVHQLLMELGNDETLRDTAVPMIREFLKREKVIEFMHEEPEGEALYNELVTYFSEEGQRAKAEARRLAEEELIHPVPEAA